MAQRKIDHHPLRDSLSSQAIPKIYAFETRHIANTSWSVSLLPIVDCPLLHALASASIPPSSHFEPCELANSAWSFAVLDFRDGPLRASLSSAARPSWHLLDVQGAAALVDAGVPGLPPTIRQALDAAIERVATTLPREAADWQVAGRLLLFNFGFDNLGSYGTLQLLRAWHIDTIAPEEDNRGGLFREKALMAHARAAQTLGSAPADSTEWAFLEFCTGQDEPDMVQEFDSWVAFSGTGRLDPSLRSPIRAFPLALNSRVERSACAEFQLLARVSLQLDDSSRGYANLYCSGTPCLSCAAALRQFQLLFPGVRLLFASGRRQFHGA